QRAVLRAEAGGRAGESLGAQGQGPGGPGGRRFGHAPRISLNRQSGGLAVRGIPVYTEGSGWGGVDQAGGQDAISFAAEIKSELAGLTPARPCCQLSELLGIFYSSKGRLIRSGDGRAAYFPLL